MACGSYKERKPKCSCGLSGVGAAKRLEDEF